MGQFVTILSANSTVCRSLKHSRQVAMERQQAACLRSDLNSLHFPHAWPDDCCACFAEAHEVVPPHLPPLSCLHEGGTASACVAHVDVQPGHYKQLAHCLDRPGADLQQRTCCAELECTATHD